MGGWCQCGSSAACICDPGETPQGITQSSTTESPGLSRDVEDNAGPETLFVLLAFVLVLRARYF
jgi:hypothetical protein